MSISRLIRSIRSVLVLLALATGTAAGESPGGIGEWNQRPLWELGIGGGVLTIPHYRGASENRDLVFPFVYPVYRGRYLRIDDQGVSGLLYTTPRFEFDLSADGTFPADSDDIIERQGMPDLDPVLQLGPVLKIALWQQPQRRQSLELNLPLRFAFAIDSGVDGIGYTSSPHVTYYRDVDWISRTWRLGLSGGVEYGSREFHDFYYSVDPQFATRSRAAFDADGGYGGTRFTATFHGRARNNWISVFARYDRVDGAVFEDSPLVGSRDGWTAGVVVSFFVARSKRTVRIPPRGVPGRAEEIPK